MHTSYEIWALAAIGLLIGAWGLRTIKHRITRVLAIESKGVTPDCSCRDHDLDHQALVFLMDQKTDSMLAALARTIENERKKLGMGVRKSSMTPAIDALAEIKVPSATDLPSRYNQILPLATSGLAIAKIARELHLPEAEVSMVLRLNAA